MEINQIWGGHEFEIYHLPESPCSYESTFARFQGMNVIYIFACPRYDGREESNPWVPVYIGETGGDLLGRMADWSDRTQYLSYTTHIHLHQESIKAYRKQIEKELIQCYGPLENKQHNALGFLHLKYDSQSLAFCYTPDKMSISEWQHHFSQR